MAEAILSAQPPKKTVVKETPHIPVSTTSAKTKPTQKNQFLKTCFEDIVNRKTLHLNSKGISDILFYDLNIEFKNLSMMMKYVISECMCNYMKIWPGWDDYRHRGPESLDECFHKFKEYIKFKIDFIIANQKLFYDEEIKPKKTVLNAETQTESLAKQCKPDAPYNLVICGQPNILNNIVFIELDNNVVIKKHTEKPWKQLVPTEFLNYPFVHVSVNLPLVKLTRSNIHEYKRYITECGDTASAPDVDLIHYVTKTDPRATEQVYSFEYITAYFSQLVKVLSKIGVKILPQLQAIFHEFLKDINESSVQKKTMASPYTVCYNIGQKTYIRNKKMVHNSNKNKESNALNYCEVIIPKLAFTLTEFNVEEDVMTPDVTFVDLNRILALPPSEQQAIAQEVNGCVSYQCLLCSKNFQGENGYAEVHDHFRYLHKGEQAVLCFKCRKPFEVYTLAGQRWSHECPIVIKEKDLPRVSGGMIATRSDNVVNGTTNGTAKPARPILPVPHAGVLRNHLETFVDPRTTTSSVVNTAVASTSNAGTSTGQHVYGVFGTAQ